MNHGREENRAEGRAPKLCLVCSHGGHLTEMLELAEAFEGFEAFYYSYEGETTRSLPGVYLTPNKPYSPWRFLVNLVACTRMLRRERPAFVVSTGAEIAIPPFLAAKMLRIPTLYVQCGCQVTKPSRTGRIIIHIADRFFVQWPELLEAYGKKAEYRGSLIDDTRPGAAS